jgi:hypothetical protein
MFPDKKISEQMLMCSFLFKILLLVYNKYVAASRIEPPSIFSLCRLIWSGRCGSSLAIVIVRKDSTNANSNDLYGRGCLDCSTSFHALGPQPLNNLNRLPQNPG